MKPALRVPLLVREISGKRVALAASEALGGPGRIALRGEMALARPLIAAGFEVAAAPPFGGALLVALFGSPEPSLDLDELPPGARVVSLERTGGLHRLKVFTGTIPSPEDVSAAFLAAGLVELEQRHVGNVLLTSGTVALL